jgi:CrcB protein
MLWLGVALLGALGALARFHLDAQVERRAAGAFPLGTLAVNGSGCLALGLLTGSHVTGDAALLAGSATLGAYTTFSTWMYETHRLAEEGELRAAAANVVVSLVLGASLAALGWALGAAL